MRLEIFAEDKPAQKTFHYELTFSGQKLLLAMAALTATIALASLASKYAKKNK
ncbi:hypothetical protein [Streptococcus massiliensis]|uniref:Uncharacterized protein n=1 Tax=Streptococcus massiliensis TaxID=313439 RepID=A0A380L081_9STRE|nr:hypothetical protein [Streptococcus massiliensis]SUN76959.1 Uncharacterised protein [Streptococcus massiliensis]